MIVQSLEIPLRGKGRTLIVLAKHAAARNEAKPNEYGLSENN